MKEFLLKYGCNPNQNPARLYMESGKDLPFCVLNGRPGYINFLDALNAWQLVKELKTATGQVAATSFKHVSPTSASLGRPLGDRLKRACFVDDVTGLDDSPLACAYARARGTDRMSSFGDFIALSDPCDKVTAEVIAREVSDGVIAPGYEAEALEILRQKKKGAYAIVEIDPDYTPELTEKKQVFGVTFEQRRNDLMVTKESLTNVVTKRKDLPEEIKEDMIVALVTLKYTQSNSVCFAFDGQAIGVGAGQQSRIHCTRLAAQKADLWNLRQSEKVLNLPFLPDLARPEYNNVIDLYLSDTDSGDVLDDGRWQRCFTERPEPFLREEKDAYLSKKSGLTCASDAFFPFADNVYRANKSGVEYICQPGGSIRDGEVIAACDDLGILMLMTGQRLFHH
ncbi:MAG: phosphoribosylaminoimidazolecarboxamide formyltransferase [Clostridia bacterium]|nr:phosphoribosylaminoimidazolecarboxamide formyltransferase [Clostridia bacterium]